MPITEADIKLVESERMSDTTDGGGRRTSREIADGVIGNVFPKISRLDSVYGRINMRKVYGWIDTPSLEMYAGAHAIITDAPNNPAVHCTIFTTGSDFDVRTQARDRIESHTIAGPESRMRLYGRQLMLQQAIAVYQRVEEPLPEIGDVLCLSHEVGGVTIKQQFVRVTELSHDVRSFEDTTGEYQRRVITLRLSSTLRYEFTGDEYPARLVSQGTGTTRVRTTTVADASRYYGIRNLTDDGAVGALELNVDSIFAHLVPTTQRETPVSLAEISGAGQMIRASDTPRTEPVAEASTANMSWTTTRPIYPGTLTFTQGGGGYPHHDDGHGNIIRELDDAVVGTVDYEAGQVTHTSLVAVSIGFEATYVPAARLSQPAHTRRIPITLATRGTVYVETLLPVPAPGTTQLDFRAVDRWYRLRDVGAGQMQGDDPAYGVGTIDYVTGALIVTLGALPDVGSSILLAWGSPTHATIRRGAAASAPQWTYTADEDMVPGSIALTWEAGGVVRTATDDGEGRIQGDAAGHVSYSVGALWFTPLVLPDASSDPLLEYETGGLTEETFTPVADGNGMVTVTLAGAPAVPRSVELLWQTVRAKTVGERTGKTVNAASYLVVPAPVPPPAPAPAPGPAPTPAPPAEPVRPTPPIQVGSGGSNAYMPRVTEWTADPALIGRTKLDVRGIFNTPVIIEYHDAALRP